ncbi:MAG: hypothetical protein KF778_08645 [Rhodocyclaceae bacterium]|nr:hypothetical protein [Rhodocyclaceae bacterium]MBX3668455.1 hypothetical protein [Rhodocyclaceae bacterium]
MPARELEFALLARCASAARELGASACDQREANLFRLAGMLLYPRFPGESKALLKAAERYFTAHPEEILAPAELVRKGWVVSLPRLRDMLGRQLAGH